jgi:hypothetical protein
MDGGGSWGLKFAWTLSECPDLSPSAGPISVEADYIIMHAMAVEDPVFLFAILECDGNPESAGLPRYVVPLVEHY